jgi:hypothetical protein
MLHAKLHTPVDLFLLLDFFPPFKRLATMSNEKVSLSTALTRVSRATCGA